MNLCTAAAFFGINLCENTVPISNEVERTFIEHLADYGISYGTQEEYQFRLSVFAKKDAQYKEINANPEHTFEVGHNKFSTWTDDEFQRMLGAKPNTNASKAVYKKLPTDNLPDAIDWRAQGAVNPVKNQGQCGSCWAFSATAAVEGHHKIATGELLDLSEEQLVECETISHGCGGGWKEQAFAYLQNNPQELQSDYPYKWGNVDACHADPSKGRVSVPSYNNVPSGTAADLLAAIAQGPVAVVVRADTPFFAGYKNGIVNTPACGTEYNHAITAVGYGKNSAGHTYYIVRNSWSADWGNKGYINIMAVDGPGICGIQQWN